jgi:hypothetical protein
MAIACAFMASLVVACGTPPPADVLTIPTAASLAWSTRTTTGSQIAPQEVSIVIHGQSFEWNGMSQDYDASPAFSVNGRLIIAESNSRRGLEVALVGGSWASGAPGSLVFLSNSELAQRVRSLGSHLTTAAVPVAAVRSTDSGRTLQVEVDPGMARTLQTNLFIPGPRPGLSQIVGGTPIQIVGGTIALTQDGQSIRGEMELNGSGYIEPGNGAFPTKVYKATFST